MMNLTLAAQAEYALAGGVLPTLNMDKLPIPLPQVNPALQPCHNEPCNDTLPEVNPALQVQAC